MGNTRGRDLTENLGTQKDQHLDMLLLASGDVRNLLFTISGLSLRKPNHRPKSISFHLNDYDPSIVARNAVVLEIANTIDPDVKDDVDFLWNVWYNMTLSRAHFDRLQAVFESLIDRDFSDSKSFLKFQSSSVLEECQGIWKDWKELELDVNSVKEQRKQCMGIKSSYLDVITQLLVSPYDIRDALSSITDEARRWFEEGSTNDEQQAVNPTLMRPFVHEWKVHHAACPFEGYFPLRREDFLRCGSITAYCKEVLQTLVKQFQKFQADGTSLEMCLWTGDALCLCTSGFSPDMTFDVIDTNSVSDIVGLLNVLVCCSPRLKRPNESQLLTSSISWCEDTECMKEYYSNCVGIPFHLLPTVLGLKLAVDFDFGTRKLPGKKTNTEETLCWVKAEKTRTILTLEERSEVVNALLELTGRCFRHFKLIVKTEGLPYRAHRSSPLTLMRILHQLHPLIEGGATRALELLQKELSTGLLNETYLSWNLVNGCVGDVKEPIVEVKVKVEITFDLVCQPVQITILDRDIFENPERAHSGPINLRIVHNGLRYDPDDKIVTFHLLEKDWNDIKDKSFLQIVSNVMKSVESAHPIMLNDEDQVLSVKRVDPVESFGLFSVQAFDVRPTKNETSTLKLIKVEEGESSYQAELAFLDPANSKSEDLKFSWRPENCPTQVNVKMGDIDGCTMYFSCPVEKNSMEIWKASEEESKVTVFVLKKEEGTVGEDVLQNPGPVPFHALGHWKIEKRTTKKICKKMFRTSDELEMWKEGKEGDSFFSLRESICNLLTTKMNYPETPKAYILDSHQNTNVPSSTDEDLLQKQGVIIKVEEVYNWNNLPVFKVNFCDCKRFGEIIKSNPTAPESERLLRTLAEGFSEPTLSTVVAKEEVIDSFRKLLYTNAARVHQEDVADSVWKASFITLLFPREGEPHIVERTIEMGLEFPSELMAGFVANVLMCDSDADDSPPPSPTDAKCVVCHKEAQAKCGRCHQAFYCSAECQKQDWESGHKFVCSPK